MLRHLLSATGLVVVLLAFGLGCESDPASPGSPGGGSSDTIAPTVVSIFPEDGAVAVSRSVTIVITFSEAVSSGATATLTQGAVPVATTASLSGQVLTLIPVAELAGSTTYTVTVGTTVTDLAGNPLAQAVSVDFQTQAGAELDTGLVAYWSFDSGFGADVGGSELQGQPSPGVDLDPVGRFGAAASFDRAESEYIQIGQPVITPGVDHSYSAWYYLDIDAILGGDRYFVMESDTYSVSYGLRAGGSGAEGQVFTVTQAGPNDSRQFPTPGVRTWQNILVTYDASEGLHTIYLDGTLVDSMDNTPPLAETFSLVIGGHRGFTGRNWNGLIDDVAVWDRVLTSADIAEIQSNPVLPGSGGGAPMVTQVSPSDGAVDVSNSVTIVVTFDRDMEGGNASQSNVLLLDGSLNQVGVFPSVTGTQLTIDPYDPLVGGQTYTVRLEPTLYATDGNALGTPYESTFSTASSLTVTSVTPSDNATAVPIDTDIVVEFSAPIDPASVNASTFRVEPSGWIDNQFYQQGAALDGTAVVSGNMVTWTPTRGSLGEYLVDYEIVVAGVQSTSGATLETPLSSEFTTPMFDFYYSYRIYNEGTRLVAGFEVDAGGNAFLNTEPTRRGAWHFLRFANRTSPSGEQIYFMANDRDGDGQYLDGGNGSQPASMQSSSTTITSRQFYFPRKNSRTSPHRTGESGSVYNLRTIDQGTSQALKAVINSAQTGYDIKMQSGSSNVDQIWFFKNVGRRF